MKWYEKLFERIDGRGKWAFDPLFFVWIFLGSGAILVATRYFAGTPSSFSATMAVFGAFGACCGVVTIGRPMIRKGGYLSWYKDQQIVGGGSYQETPEEAEEKRQGIRDALSVQIIGPALVFVGTMVNGLSGFFG